MYLALSLIYNYRFDCTILVDTAVHRCSGCGSTGGHHVEITNPPSRRRICQLYADDYKKFEGHFSEYFADMISIEKEPVEVVNECWRSHEGSRLCDGKRTDYPKLVTSLPTMLLAVEVANERVSRQDFEVPLYIWDFPATIFPSTKSSGKNSGLVYDLIGYGLTNLHGDHFTARYASHDKKTIYTYDGMKNDSFSIKESNATFNSHMVGTNINIPSGFVVYEAFYILRGGLKAQELFYSIHTKALTKRFGLHFSQSNLDSLVSLPPWCTNPRVLFKWLPTIGSGLWESLRRYWLGLLPIAHAHTI